MAIELLLAPLLSFVLCLLLTPLARRVALRVGLVDRPDGHRKLHKRVVPVIGGPPILLAVTLASAALLGWSGWLGPQARLDASKLLGLLGANVFLCLVGIADDFGRLRGRHKVLGQLIAATIVVVAGLQVHTIRLFGANLDLGVMAVPFTLFLLLGATNSLNLIDGMDGLLSSVGLIICLALGVLAVASGQLVAAAVAFALAGALLGFLCFNFPPASVFLGDSGSMMIGLTVGVLAIHSCLKGPATVALAAPTALLTIPIFDTAVAILRRKLTGRSIYSPDRGHLHHCLLRRLSDPRHVLLIISACCLFTVAGAFASLLWHNEVLAVVSGLTVVAMLLVTGLFGHAELLLLLQRLKGALKSLWPAPAAGREIAVRLEGSADWRELWMGMISSAGLLQLCRLRLDVNAPALGEGYHARWDRSHDSEVNMLWRFQAPLALNGRVIGEVELAGRPDEVPVWDKVAAIARLVEEFEPAASLLTGGVAPPPRPAAHVVVLPPPHVLRPEQASVG
jgi:UDP-GlcNAc:undecaprenyl-phosphate GlcNAc-1-phosphate transferase